MFLIIVFLVLFIISCGGLAVHYIGRLIRNLFETSSLLTPEIFASLDRIKRFEGAIYFVIPIVTVFISILIAALITVLTGFLRFSARKFFLFFFFASSTIIGLVALLSYSGSTLFSSTIVRFNTLLGYLDYLISTFFS